MIETHSQTFREGYTDAYYGKDKRENYTGAQLKEYLDGIETFFQESTLDVMQELNG